MGGAPYDNKAGLFMTGEEYDLFRDLISREFGIVMKGDKRLTLHTKLAHRLSILGLASYRDYYELIVSEPSKEELVSFISHITNSETYFQRDPARMTLFPGLLNDVKRCRQEKDRQAITVLSAGCSSGEEVYTLNIMLLESGLFAWGWDVRVIGVDVNAVALKKAESGIYTKNSFRLLNGNEEFSRKYFDRRGDLYILRKPYRANVEFIRGNILRPEAFEGIGIVDVIFCRNVFIYMSDETVERVVGNFYHHLSDDGYLFIGSSESLLNKTDLFVSEYREGNIVYRKNSSLSG